MRQYAPEPEPVAEEPPPPDLLSQARATLDGSRRGPRALLPFLGPAFIACVAYIDPGNFATNITGGSAFGYNLLWVILMANLIAILMQSLSAKLGIASGLNLAEACREHFPKPVSYGMWLLAEIGAMATDLAEFLGASLGIYLLFHIPLLPSALITGVATLGMLALQRRGVRPLEALIAALVAVIAACYVIETFLSKPDWGQVAFHAVVPYIVPGSVLVSVGILGATVMPHVIYLHSALTQNRITPRNEAEAKRIFRFTIPDIVLAMGLAGLINMAMLYMAAATFHGHGFTDVASIESAHQTLTPLLGSAASVVFAISLLASGLSSSTVGTMAGQVIMQGFVGFSIPLWLRRLVTMLPAIGVIAIGADPTLSLVISQVVLSMVLPLPVLTLVYLTRRRDVMGSLVNKPVTTVVASICACIIVALNVLLLFQTFGGRVPGLA